MLLTSPYLHASYVVRVHSPGRTERPSKQKKGERDKETPKQALGLAAVSLSCLGLTQISSKLQSWFIPGKHTQGLVSDSKAKQTNKSFLLGFSPRILPSSTVSNDHQMQKAPFL